MLDWEFEMRLCISCTNDWLLTALDVPFSIYQSYFKLPLIYKFIHRDLQNFSVE